MRSREIDLPFDRDRLCAFLLPCFFSRDLDDILFGDLLRDLLRFLERLRDLYFAALSFRLSRDLDSDRLVRRLGDNDRRLRDSDRDRLREIECRLDRDRLRDMDRLRDLRLVRDDDLLRELERHDLEYD